MTAPHQPIASHYGAEGDKHTYLRSLFDRAAPHYDRINGFGFLWTGGVYRRRALSKAGLRPGMDVLDVACGTGPVSRACLDLLLGQGLGRGARASGGRLERVDDERAEAHEGEAPRDAARSLEVEQVDGILHLV